MARPQFEIKVTRQGFDEFGQAVSDPELVAIPLRKLLFKARGIAQREAKAPLAQAGTRTAVRSISASVGPLSMTLSSKMHLDRALSIEEGRAKGIYPAAAPLTRWAAAVGHPAATNRREFRRLQERLGFAGTSGKHFVSRALEALKERVPELIRELGDSIGVAWSR